MTCDHCFGRGHSPILRQPENDYSEHSMPDDPYYCACERGRALRAFAEANLPPPARVTETPEVEAAPEVAADAPKSGVPDVHGLRNYGCDLRGLLGPPDLAKVEANVTAALSEAFAPFGFNAEWRVDRSRALDELGTLFGVMRIEPRRPK